MEIKLKAHIPHTPNFIKVGENMIELADFSDEDLRQIGKEWTELLIAKARQPREAKD